MVEVIEDEEDRVGARVIRQKIIRTDDAQYPSGYCYALHYGYVDGRGTILRYDNENQTPGRHERHTEDDVTEIEFSDYLRTPRPIPPQNRPSSMTDNTLKITFKQQEQHRDAARERLKRAEAGERGDAIEQDVRFILNFETYDDIARLMRTSNLELIKAVVEHQPDSIRSAAAAVDRDYREVHRNLKELEDLGVIEFEAAGQGKKPVLRGGAETIDFSIQFPGPPESEELTGASV